MSSIAAPSKTPSELRTNIEQLLQRLEEGVLLFDDTRPVAHGQRTRRENARQNARRDGGRSAHRRAVSTPPFSGRSSGALLKAAADRRTASRRFRARWHAPCGWWSAFNFCKSGSAQEDMGMLVTLRDVESRRQLEQQLDFSSRLAAISRLTGGVAHEIKNPLNAMALHLEVLKGKLDGRAAGDRSHRPRDQAPGYGGEDLPEFQPAGGSELHAHRF